MPLTQTEIISCANSSTCDTHLSKECHSVASDGSQCDICLPKEHHSVVSDSSECNTYLSKERHSVAPDGSKCDTHLSKERDSVVSPQQSFSCVHYFHNFTASLRQGLVTLGQCFITPFSLMHWYDQPVQPSQ